MEYDCDGCGDRIERYEEGRIYCRTPLGDACLFVHKNQDCGKLALELHPGWEMMPGNKPPESKRDRMEREMKEQVEKK